MKNIIISAFLSLAVGCGPASRGTDESGQQALAEARREATKAEEKKKDEAACVADPTCTRPGLKTPTQFVGAAPELPPETPSTKEKEDSGGE